jgi:hypothetical protein
MANAVTMFIQSYLSICENPQQIPKSPSDPNSVDNVGLLQLKLLLGLLPTKQLDVVGAVGTLGLLRLDDQAGLTAVRLVGLADATVVDFPTVLVGDLVFPFCGRLVDAGKR